MINVGNDNYISRDKIVAIVPSDTSRIKDEIKYRKTMEVFERTGDFIDATRGGKHSSVVICEDGVYILSSIKPNTLAKRYIEAGY